MVDTTTYSEGQNLTVQLVKDSPSKKCVVMQEAKPEVTDFGEKLTTLVEIDGKQKIWRMNRDSVKNMQNQGIDSKLWLGKQVDLRVVTISGKESVVGMPVMPIVD